MLYCFFVCWHLNQESWLEDQDWGFRNRAIKHVMRISWGGGGGLQQLHKKSKVQKDLTKMEGEVCIYLKFGFCKFKNMCKRKHYKEECNNQNCQEKNTCQKRHHKSCRRYSLGNIRFKKDCAFKHPSKLVVKDQCEIEQKVKFLENIVHEMAAKCWRRTPALEA